MISRLLELQGRSPKLAVAKMRLVAQWGQLQPQECAVSTHEALLRSSVSIVTVVTKGQKGHTHSPGVCSLCHPALQLLELQGRSPKLAVA